jgi:phage-related minor tail protein
MFASGGGFGRGVMGEAGPEAVMPLTRGADGKLGVAGGGGNSMVVNIIEAPGQGGKQEQRSGSNGVDILDVYVEKIKASIAGDINKGSGAVPAALGRTYNLNRTAGAY